MPKGTFLNLPDDKKQTLIQAIKLEFSRVPLYKASITNIITSANIPRGSFYQYFEDKEDAFFFLLNEHVKENKDKFISILRENNGDLFDTMIEFYRLILTEGEENPHFLKNIFLNMTYKIESTYASSFIELDKDGNFTEAIGSFINTAHLNISNDKDLTYIMQIIIAVTLRNFVEKFAHDLSIDEAVNHYLNEIKLLKNGLER
ncbi:TetR family transcriptional regulator [Bacillus sp. FJAT-27225]|uniref:TetR/AcrR family transcriptional regulator n=1 Tax=Bacillus sp. FJAT-27225 TaxID=1743144 RepID=UPI00080C290B|nr:TetR/AcrR family transcriptional regulator [Bacillus sp. FJAT-27225]OCA90707.1 TetR family transcriptional regulator [Bacillus sp. FJAT-27225]